MAKKIAAIILGVLDAVLLIVIIISVSTGWRIRRDAPVQSEEDQTNTASLPSLSESSAPSVVSDEPSKQESSAPPVVSDEPSQQESSAPPVVSDEPSKQESSAPPVVSDEPSQQESSVPPVVSDEPSKQESSVPPVVSDEPSKQESSVPPVVSDEPSKQESSVPPVVSDEPSQQESSAPPVVSDEPSTQESTVPPVVSDEPSKQESSVPPVVSHGWTGFSPDSVYIPEAYQVIGGWKAYFVIDPDQKMGQAIEKFANVNISFAQSGMTVTVDWYRTFNGDLTKGTPDNAPDSSFSGEWSSGMIDAVGSGRIILGEFCYDHGREYAAGRMIWPDGTESVIGLIRP